MPKTIHEILDHADRLAQRFEDWDPGPGTTVTVTPLGRLYDAVRQRAASEREVAEAVAAARADGTSWRVVGLALGTSGQAARQRYGSEAHPDSSGE